MAISPKILLKQYDENNVNRLENLIDFNLNNMEIPDDGIITLEFIGEHTTTSECIELNRRYYAAGWSHRSSITYSNSGSLFVTLRTNLVSRNN